MCRIKADWDTLQIFMKSRVSNPFANGGPQPKGVSADTGGLQRCGCPQILYLSEFHHIPLVWLFYRSDGSRMAPKATSYRFFLQIMCLATGNASPWRHLLIYCYDGDAKQCDSDFNRKPN